jgi:hypothetical protein
VRYWYLLDNVQNRPVPIISTLLANRSARRARAGAFLARHMQVEHFDPERGRDSHSLPIA